MAHLCINKLKNKKMKSKIHEYFNLKNKNMRKTTTKIISTLINFKKVLSVVLLVLAFSFSGHSQGCTAAFTYTLGSNGQVSFTDASVGTTTNTAYNWSYSGFSGWGSSTAPSPTFTFTYNGTYYVYLNISDSMANCQSSVMDTIVITNGQTCQVSFTYTVSPGSQVDFTNTSVGNVAYDFDFGDGNWAIGNLPGSTLFHNYTYNGTYTVTLWSDTTGGYCGGYAQAVITITGAQPCAVYANFVYSNNGNGVYTFTDTVTINPPVTNHYWYVNGAFVGSGNPFTYPFNSNGAFTVCEVAQDSSFMGFGCSDTSCVSLTVGNVACNDSAYFYLFPDSNQIGNGIWYAYLYATNNYPVNALWSWGDGTYSSGLFPSHNYTTAGWYNICVTAYFACGDSSTYCELDSVYKTSNQMVTINVLNGVNSIHANINNMTSLKAYPNPFTDGLTLNFTSYENKTITYTMFDMMGNQVAKENVSVHKGDNEFKINTNGISKGVYFINLSGNAGKKTSTIKVVK